MPDYSKGKIYAIICNDTGKAYIGSTTTTLINRHKDHKKHWKQWVAGKRDYTACYEILKGGNYKMHLLENVPCKSKRELEQAEAEYMNHYVCVNKNILKCKK